MEAVEDVVIIGAGLAGLATALGLHRMGIKSLVLESSDSLRSTGFALTTWTNAWRALDSLGAGDSLRRQSLRLQRETTYSVSSGALTSQQSLTGHGKLGEHEVRCVQRNLLVETLERELPKGTIRYSSKLASIDDAGDLKLLHLADGSTLKTKVLVGCDGVNSVVASWLGLAKPTLSGRLACRGFARYQDGHGFKPEFTNFYGEGFRCGFLPCDEKSVYWYFTWTPTSQETERDAAEMKRFVLSKMRASKVPEEMAQMVEKSETGGVLSSMLRFRSPLELVRGDISKGNACVAGDALHPMTPDLGQGGCSALEDGVVLARCLGEALLDGGAGGERERIEEGLAKYARERRWRSVGLVAKSYVVGYVQESRGWAMGFLREKRFMSEMMAGQHLKMADFDCGTL